MTESEQERIPMDAQTTASRRKVANTPDCSEGGLSIAATQSPYGAYRIHRVGDYVESPSGHW
jgi:hypothetical protein